MPLTDPINSANISDVFTSEYMPMTAFWYSANLPFSDFSTGTGGITLLSQTAPTPITNVGSGVISAENIYQNLVAATANYTNFRRLNAIRAVRFNSFSRNGFPGRTGTNNTDFGTQFAAMPTTYRRTADDVSSVVSNSLTGNMTKTSLQTLMSNLYNRWAALRDNNATVTVTVCHSSCHSSCHNSRSRR
jgi:hypothetical protein